MTLQPSRHTYPRKSITVCVILLLLAGGIFAHLGMQSTNHELRITDVQDTVRGKIQKGDTAYNSLVARGDDFFKKKQYVDALKLYEQAQKIRPNDYYVKGKITQVRNIQAELARADAEYTKEINSGDDYFKQQDYLNAKAAYQLALNVRPGDAYATSKMNETLELLRSQKAKNILYDVTIDSAEKLFAAKEYDKAIEQYENASKILPNEKYPKEKINAIIKIKTDLQTRDAMYAQSIASADKFYQAKNWAGALKEYRNAASYKPEEQYPQDRIKELEALLGAQKDKDDAYDKAIAAADKFFAAGTYSDARTGYQEASKIKPEEAYPKNKIKEIDAILANRSKMDNEYQRLIDAADSLYIGRNYMLAKLNYQEALRVKPGEAYPKEMISKSDQGMAGQAASEKQIEEAYQSAIASADRAFGAKDYTAARSGYQTALSIKPDEKYPKDKLAEIDGIDAEALK
ncbi:MAG TPA: hypothetical protein VMC08_05545, partial [Bacteroidales bacterium]|nr:hypothetical protein [Bacteroidales bacterium]